MNSMTIPNLTYRTVVRAYPLALLGAAVLLLWMAQRHQNARREYASLQHAFTSFFHSAKGEAESAFSGGDFQKTAALLDPTGSSASADPGALLLRARSLECLGYFSEAATLYTKLETLPGKRLAVVRGRVFCQRMSSERGSAGAPSRQVLYRIHDELMRRGDITTARFIARKLLPDTQPLRDSLLALLRTMDASAAITASNESGCMDVKISRWQPAMLDLLRDLPIGNLSISECGVSEMRALADLDIVSLDLVGNRVSDLTALRSLSLRRLRLDDTNVADVRPLAGMPLRELHIAHTMISSIQALALCPLQKLDLSWTAVRSIEPLRGMELRELDLSHTRVTDISALAGMPIERLDLSHTSVHDLRALAGAQLKSLCLAGTAVKDLDVVANMPLTELDLRGCELLNDLQVLTQCKSLERVYLPRQIKIPAGRWQLPRLRFVEYERRSEGAIAQK
jgi:hypothetical protein